MDLAHRHRYGRQAEETVWAVAPAPLSRTRFRLRWTAVLLVIACGTAASFLVRTPLYSFGIGVVVAADPGRPNGEVRLAVFLPAQADVTLRPGDDISVRIGNRAVPRRIATVEPQVFSPDEIHTRYRLGAAADGLITGPSRVLIAEFDQLPGAVKAVDYLGSVFQVTVVVGTRRTLPAMVGQLFGAPGGAA